MSHEPEPHLVLEDRDGRYYLLPRRVIEDARVSDDQVDRLRELLGGDVSGFVSAPLQYSAFQSRGIIIIGGDTLGELRGLRR